MALTKFTKDMQVIQALDDEPNDVGGLTAAELKAKYDEAGKAIQQYINETLTVEIDANKADKSELHDIVLGQIPDGTITKTKLSSEVQASVEKADGSVQKSDKATTEEAIAGADDAKYMTPAKVKQVWDSWEPSLPTRKKINKGWELLQQYTSAGSYTWTAPDLFNGAPYKIGVLLQGGGASGVARSTNSISTTYWRLPCEGGNSGYCEAFEIQVSPSVSYNLVVGTGGAAITAPAGSNASSIYQNAGSSTSGFGKTAAGGPLWYISASLRTNLTGKFQPSTIGYNNANGADPFSQMAGTIVLDGGIPAFYNLYGVQGTFSIPSSPCLDPFSNSPIASAGQGASLCTSSSGTLASPLYSAKGTFGGAGAGSSSPISVVAGAGSYGSGGGGAVTYNQSATSGKGGDGVIKIYVQGRAS